MRNSVDKKNEHIDHLTNEVIEAYHAGKLTPEQMHQVEVLTLENPLYAEGMEGLEMLNPDELSDDLDKLTSLLDEKTKSRKGTFWSTYTRAAAVLLILVTSVSIFYLLNDQNLSTNELSRATERNPAPVDSTAGDDKSVVSPQTSAGQKSDEIEKTETESADLQSSNVTSSAAPDEVIKEFPENESTANEILEPQIKTTDITLFKAEVPKEITLPMRNFDKSLDSAIKQAIASNSQRSINLLESETLRSAANANQLKRAFVPLENDASTELLSIKGKVVGADDGLPLPQVPVLIKGTVTGTNTSANGEFALDNIRPGSSLIFRYLGYVSQEIRVNSNRDLNIMLAPDATSLGEVVVTGVGVAQDEEEALPTYSVAKPLGGYTNFNRYLRNNLRYPETAKEQKVRGRVTLEFDVSATGTLSNFKIIKGLGHGCDEEAIRLVKEGPQWTPRTEGVNKTPVSSTVKIRVRFRP